MPTLGERIRNGWNAFVNNKDPSLNEFQSIGITTNFRPDRFRFGRGTEKSILTAVTNRIAMDASSISIQHVRVDINEQFIEEIFSSMNECLRLSANEDQTGREFIQDVVMSMLDEGCVAIVPTDTNHNPNKTDSYDILSMRTGQIMQWYPKHVKVRVYNENTGLREDLILPKKMVAIVENPFYSVMNEQNSTGRRLSRKLSLLDYVDEQNGAGKLDMIIQLPYVIKTETQRNQAETRRKEIEMQLASSKYGIAYADGTEHITQLNRPVENQLLQQIQDLRNMYYSQLGITEEIMNGTANEQTMLNYYSRTIEPILSAICDEMRRKFLTKTARTQGQTITFFRDPFKLVPINNIADIADKFTRNEILSSNEVRGIIGFKPSEDPNAEELRNKNMPREDTISPEQIQEEVAVDDQINQEDYDQMSGDLDDLDAQLDELERSVQ